MGERARSRRGMVAVALLSLVAVVMVACGDDNDKAATTDTTTAAVATTLAPATTAAPATTLAGKPTVATATASMGTIAVDGDGRTLYTFDNDTAGTSACTGNCAGRWPALVLAAGATSPVAGDGITGLGVVARPDDATKMQVTMGGKPLYHFVDDAAPGDTNGDGVGGVWHVAQPA